YIPEAKGSLAGGPYPFVVLIHGFIQTRLEQSNNARFLAERGFMVLTPDIARLLWGDEKRMICVNDSLEMTNWIIDRGKTKEDPIDELVDGQRIAVGGNSS